MSFERALADHTQAFAFFHPLYTADKSVIRRFRRLRYRPLLLRLPVPNHFLLFLFSGPLRRCLRVFDAAVRAVSEREEKLRDIREHGKTHRLLLRIVGFVLCRRTEWIKWTVGLSAFCSRNQ
ncbi:Protein CBG27199 [Caenorhabditis briggsae]|uniref:Protein CBG27199 n=1 Tax=Caenorhabditis briggsae TaxID=6238 RepID=B6IL29_CAEBR|nr:Protein CBG27199 [Caenorhabditis briggsae]CAS00662.1 Protein CBG27199 [Caenorhabditis briggsae]